MKVKNRIPRNREFTRICRKWHIEVFAGYGLKNRKRRENMKRRAYYLTVV